MRQMRQVGQMQHGADGDAQRPQHHDARPQQTEQSDALQRIGRRPQTVQQGLQRQREERRGRHHGADLGRMPDAHGPGEGTVGHQRIDAGKDQAEELHGIHPQDVRGRGQRRKGHGAAGIDDPQDAGRREVAQQHLLGQAVGGPDQRGGTAQQHAEGKVAVAAPEQAQPGIEEQQQAGQQQADAHRLHGQEGFPQDEDPAQQEQHRAGLRQDLTGRGAEVGHGRVEEHEVGPQSGRGHRQQQPGAPPGGRRRGGRRCRSGGPPRSA